MGRTVHDVEFWKNPLASVPILGVGTAIYYHCHILNRPLVSLLADTLLVLACSMGTLGFLSTRFNYIVPIDPLHLALSPESAESLVACFANLLGAAEGVIRVAASGSDDRLFIKVVSFLYFVSVVVLWLTFILPYACSRLCPESSCDPNKVFLTEGENGRLMWGDEECT